MQKYVLKKKLVHIAFIMDGNGRWAKAKGLPRYLGHKKACEQLIKIVDECFDYGIKVMSFFAFSTENWNRPQDEIDHLMDYLEDFFAKQMDYLMSRHAKVVISGDLSRIREKTRNICLNAINRSKDNDGPILNICLNYGGRDEIVKASQKMAKDCLDGKLKVEDINEDTFKSYLFVPNLPDVDLLIRTSGEKRVSNFLLFEMAYAEFIFTPVKWPDFDSKALLDCLKEFDGRDRRYGGLVNE